MFGTYKKDDVIILLKDISGLMQPLNAEEREQNIQNGVHYSEMLPAEYEPTKEYLKLYYESVERYSKITADAIAKVSELIWKDKHGTPVLVSLARAGTSIGVLIKRYILKKYNVNVPHYTISIIRGIGIDHNAMEYILQRHRPEDIQFVDGWVGKGAIQNQLNKEKRNYPDVNMGLAVLSDPAYLSGKCGTHNDFLIASSCLNATVSGLLSRTVYNKNVISTKDFHGAVFYDNLLSKDLTYHFIDSVVNEFSLEELEEVYFPKKKTAQKEIEDICNEFGITDINLVKPGIGETTRVLLRRVPWKILVHSMDDLEYLSPIYQLAKEKNIQLIEYPLENYKACGLIKNLADN